MTYNINKHSIIAIIVFIILSIIIMSLFCLYSQNVYADEIEPTYIYTLNNIIMPIALTRTNSYEAFFNAFLTCDIILDISNKSITINNCRLSFAYTTITANPSAYSNEIVSTPNVYQVDFIFNASGSSTISFNDIPNYSDYTELYRFSSKVYYGDSVDDYYWTKLSITGYNINNFTQINRVQITSNEGLMDSDSFYSLYNFINYYDTNNNRFTFGFCGYSIAANQSNFPRLNTSYVTNRDFATALKNTYPISYNPRTYYFKALTQDELNNEIYNIGFEEGKTQGKIEGYEEGLINGEKVGYNNGYDKGKIDGIATKGESVWINSMSFIKNLFVDIFEIFSIEILPNVSIGTFIIIPLIFGVLFFIVKITKGD